MDTYEFTASDGKRTVCYRWSQTTDPRAVIHIAHGMGEHAARYDWVATQLAAAGYQVFANDHRGHGKTAEILGNFGEDGWNRAITDLSELIADHKAQFPDKPMVLLGHSMGAMLTQQYLELHGGSLDAAIISGSPGFAGFLQGFITRLLVRFERWRLGPDGDSELLQGLLFGAANRNFEDELEAPTGYEWLSRDAEQVKRYVEDPMCGFVPCTGSLFDIFAGASWTQQASSVAMIPTTLPIYLFSGESDPVHAEMKNIDRLLSMYRDHGLRVDTTFYPGGRHEMFNETNREQVIGDVLAWLDAHMPNPQDLAQPDPDQE